MIQQLFHDVTYNFTRFLHMPTQSSLPQPHSLHASNDITSHIEPVFRHACHARKAPVQYKLSTSPSLMLSPESSFSNSISISVSLDDSCMLTLPFFEDLYSLFQIALLLLVSLTTKTVSSTDTPATATCKEKLLIAQLCKTRSLLFCLIYGSRTF